MLNNTFAGIKSNLLLTYQAPLLISSLLLGTQPQNKSDSQFEVLIVLSHFLILFPACIPNKISRLNCEEISAQNYTNP